MFQINDEAPTRGKTRAGVSEEVSNPVAHQEHDHKQEPVST
jgi:hypothetical protein